jgi:hypothetical protein
MPVVHSFVSGIADSSKDHLVRPSNWNDGHVVNVNLASEVNGVLPAANGGVPQSLGTTNSPTFASLTLTSPLSVPNGGTGVASGNAGGIPYFSSTTTILSSATLVNNGIVIGQGVGGAPTSITAGTDNTVLKGVTGSQPTFGKVALASDVSGITPGANGGTNNGFMQFSGPATTLKTYTLPNATSTILTAANSTATTPQFARLGLGGAADATYPLLSYDRIGIRSNGTNTAGLWCDSSAGVNRAFIGLETDSASPRVGLFNSAWNFLLSTTGVTLFGATLEANYCLQLPNSASQKAKANAWDTYSDRRLKDVVGRIDNALEKVCALNGYYYHWKASAVAPAKKIDQSGRELEHTPEQLTQIQTDTAKCNAGGIAQEWAQHVPEICTLDEQGEATAINYGALTPFLVEAIKTLTTRIEVLESRA